MSKKFYITTPIYYVNARPHIGHAYTTIACDTIARRQRLMGFDTYFLTGTDEHGQKIERAAQAAGKTPQQLTDEVSAEFRALWDRMGLTYDDFIRTTSDRHKQGVQALWKRIRDNGYIYKGSYTRPVLRLRRTLRGCCRARRALPGVRTAHRDRQGRKLLLQAVGLSGQTAGALCQPAGFHPSRNPA